MCAVFSFPLLICFSYKLSGQPGFNCLYRDFQTGIARLLMALIYVILLLGKYVRRLLKHVPRAADSPLLVVVELIPCIGLVLGAAMYRICRMV